METDVKVNVIKRNGEEVSFDLLKIANAIKAANQEVAPIYQLNEYQIQAIADNVAAKISEMTHAVHVEDIQDMVETAIMEMRGYEVAQKYVRYRYKRELSRKSNTTDNGILSLDRASQRRGKSGKLQQESGDQLHPARLYGGRGQQGSDNACTAAGRSG